MPKLTTKDGTLVVTLSVATKESWKDADDNWQSRTDWHRIVSFAKLAEFTRTLTRGSYVMVQGAVRTREYKRDGDRRRSPFGNRNVANQLLQAAVEQRVVDAVHTVHCKGHVHSHASRDCTFPQPCTARPLSLVNAQLPLQGDRIVPFSKARNQSQISFSDLGSPKSDSESLGYPERILENAHEPRRSAKLIHFCSFRVTHTKNRISRGLGRCQRCHPRGSVRFGFSSSGQEPCASGVCGALIGRRHR